MHTFIYKYRYRYKYKFFLFAHGKFAWDYFVCSSKMSDPFEFKWHLSTNMNLKVLTKVSEYKS